MFWACVHMNVPGRLSEAPREVVPGTSWQWAIIRAPLLAATQHIFWLTHEMYKILNSFQWKLICQQWLIPHCGCSIVLLAVWPLVLVFQEDMFQLFGQGDVQNKKRWTRQNTYRRDREQSGQHGSSEAEEAGVEPRSNPCCCHCANVSVLLQWLQDRVVSRSMMPLCWREAATSPAHHPTPPLTPQHTHRHKHLKHIQSLSFSLKQEHFFFPNLNIT